MALVFFLLGIGVIALGVVALRHSKRMDKLGRSRARVHDCQPSTMEILSQSIPCYEVTFEIQTASGTFYKSMKDELEYQVGDYVEIFYDAQNDKIELPKNVSPVNSKGPYAVIAFGGHEAAVERTSNNNDYNSDFDGDVENEIPDEVWNLIEEELGDF